MFVLRRRGWSVVVRDRPKVVSMREYYATVAVVFVRAPHAVFVYLPSPPPSRVPSATTTTTTIIRIIRAAIFYYGRHGGRQSSRYVRPRSTVEIDSDASPPPSYPRTAFRHSVVSVAVGDAIAAYGPPLGRFSGKYPRFTIRAGLGRSVTVCPFSFSH